MNKLSYNRIEYLDIAKALLIILVIIGHAVDNDTIFKEVIYSFHMPAFFIVSGMVIRKKNNFSIKQFLGKRIDCLIIPFVIWGLIYSEFSFKNLCFILYGSRETLVLANSLTSLWYIPVFFISSFIMQILIQKCKKKTILVLVGITTFLCGTFIPRFGSYGYPFGANVSFVALSFLIFGFIIKHFETYYVNNWKCYTMLILISLLMILVGIKFNSTSEGYVLMANSIYGNRFMFLLSALGGSCFVILISIPLSKILKHKKTLLYIGQNTFGIFLIHKPFVLIFRSLLQKIGLDPNNLILIFSTTLVTVILSTITVMIITYFIPEILGKKRKRGVLYANN